MSVPVVILYCLGIFAVLIYRVSLRSHAVADFFRDSAGFAVRLILTSATNLLPFSLGEIILFISVPLGVFLLVRFCLGVKRAGNRRRELLWGLSRFAAFACVIMFLFAFTLGVGYGATPIQASIGLERRLISPDDLVYAMRVLIDEANAEISRLEAAGLYFNEDGSTAMPYDLRELNARLHQAFINLNGRHGSAVRLIRSRAKPIIISGVFSRMNITGVYSFFTGEGNINMHPPDFSIVFTAAHEMAHAMGVAREDEANFAAFLACLHSDCSYIRYSGLVVMISWLRWPLFEADPDAYYELMGRLSSVAREELRSNARFWERYRGQPLARVATAVNDAYLRAQAGGRDEGERHLGVATYGLVRDLAVIYLRDIYGR